MKTDTQKLKEILKLIKRYRQDINEAIEQDCEVTLGSNGINCYAASQTFRAFEEDVAEILK
jgi:hypothetical protein